MKRSLSHFARLGIMVAVALSVETARGDILTINPTADATITDSTGDGTFDTIDSGDLVNSVRYFPNDVIDRSVIEYSLAALPTNATINSVTFNFATQSFTSSSTNVDLFGYVGDGVTTLSDATAAANFLQSFNPSVLGLGAHSVNLGATTVSLLQSILGIANFVGLRLQDTTDTANTQIYSLEGSSALNQPAPVLMIDYSVQAVPEPSSVALVGIGVLGVIGFGLRRRIGADV